MNLYSSIKDYFTHEEVLSLDLSVKKNTDTTSLSKEELLKALCTQEKFLDIHTDILAVKSLLAQKGIKQCTPEERKKLYDELDIPVYSMGKVEEALGCSQEAITYLKVAASYTDVLAARAAIELGNLYYQAKDLVKAEQAYKQAIEKDDKNRCPQAHIALGNFYCVYQTTQAYGWAEACYYNAITQNNPEITAQANLLLGHLYSTINRLDRATTVYERAASSGFDTYATPAQECLAKLKPSGLDGNTGNNGQTEGTNTTGQDQPEGV